MLLSGERDWCFQFSNLHSFICLNFGILFRSFLRHIQSAGRLYAKTFQLRSLIGSVAKHFWRCLIFMMVWSTERPLGNLGNIVRNNCPSLVIATVAVVVLVGSYLYLFVSVAWPVCAHVIAQCRPTMGFPIILALVLQLWNNATIWIPKWLTSYFVFTK